MSLFRRLFGGGRREPEVKPVLAPAAEIQTLEPQAAAELIRTTPDLQLLDVRSAAEHQGRHIPGSRLIPLPELPERMAELDPARPLLVYCEHGMRSWSACSLLSQSGFARLYNLSGGMSEWEARVRA